MGPEESQGYSEFWIYQGSEYASCYMPLVISVRGF